MTKALTEYELSKLVPPKTLTTASTAELAKAKADGKEELLTMMFLTGASRERFGGLVTDCYNGYLQGVDKYPGSRSEAYSLMNKWKAPMQN